MAPRFWILLAAVVLVAIAGVMFFGGSEEAPEPAPAPVERTPAPVPRAAPEPTPEPEDIPNPEPAPETESASLPALGASDAFVRNRAGVIVEGAELDPVLSEEQLLRRFTVVLENLAAGGIAREPLDFMPDLREIPVQRRDGTIYLDPAGYARFEPMVAMVESLRPRQAVGFLRLVEPLLDDAYAELGERDVDVEARLVEAIDIVLATPEVDRPVELVQPTVAYEFADAELEALAPSQKLLLRMGPENAAIVRARLREIRALLDPEG